MSSFIGHGLLGGTIGTISYPPGLRAKIYRPVWVGWLVIIALIPDLDYAVPMLQASANAGLRITHSLLVALLFPILTLLGLLALGMRQHQLWQSGLQLTLAGLSHLGMDLLVGVTPLPLLWPVSDRPFRLPFGLLPSAGKISLYNYYFYYNLGIELGVLLPLIGCFDFAIAAVTAAKMGSQRPAVMGVSLLYVLGLRTESLIAPVAQRGGVPITLLGSGRTSHQG
ncbi:MAG: metal-dependent hydrolase [Leptolyngbyaceae cyanobacterium]